ncbi:MAG: phage tail tape measure protein [Negativicoccus succinicivorans]|uniref:phage tail tape measure protein n=1 Tax=Negativicoccus succinicivorans TaxID=620903 RepID=UPI0023557ADE|nr:phage tail tape measure protein [Negativicoccus succinicivorans]MBS5890598.1 phage tail tape measure protein [Negativicoccus succinicivorans]
MSKKAFEFALAISGKVNSSLRSAMKIAQERVRGLEQAQQRLNRQYARGQMTAEQLADRHRRLASEIDRVTKAQKKCAEASALANKIRGMRDRAGNIALKAGAITGAAIALPVKEAMDFEDAMAEVRKVVDFDTPKQFKEMGQDIQELSTKIPMTAEEIAELVAAGGQSGIAREELVRFAEDAGKMGVAFDIGAEKAGETMAKFRTAFKMSQDDVIELADKINYLGNTTAATAPNITDVVRRIGPLGEVGGLASGSIAAIGASMIGAGVESEVAATGIKGLILSLTAGESATERQASALQKLGFDAKQMAVDMQKDANGAILKLFRSLQNIDASERAAVLKNLFGKESIGAITPLLSNLEGLEQNLEKVGDKAQYAGSMQKEFDTRSATLSNSLKLAKNGASNLMVAIGNNLAPAVKVVAEIFKGAAKFLKNFSKEHEMLAKIVIVGGAAIGVLTTLVAGAAWAFLSIAYPIQQARTLLLAFNLANNANIITTGIAIARSKAYVAAQLIHSAVTRGIAIATNLWTAAQWALNVAMSANPIGLLIVGIAALVVAGVWMYKNWNEITAFMSNMWEGAKAAVSSFVDTVRNLFSPVFDWLQEKWASIKNLFSSPIQASVSTGAASSVQVAGNAAGGIYGKGAFLTTFAEESGESAIPHTPTRRNVDLLAKTNAIMGNPLGGGGGMNINFNPSITINGNADRGDVEKALATERRRFADMLDSYMAKQRRVAYE